MILALAVPERNINFAAVRMHRLKRHCMIYTMSFLSKTYTTFTNICSVLPYSKISIIICLRINARYTAPNISGIQPTLGANLKNFHTSIKSI